MIFSLTNYFMKKLITLLLIIAFHCAYAQDSLNYFNYNREQVKKKGMEVLGSWAIVNLAIATPVAYNTTGSTKYFYQMNALWNLGNLGAAVSGYISASRNIDKVNSPSEILREQRKIEGVFLINGGLDVAYIGAGIYLNNRGNRDGSEKLSGYGSAFVLQGAVLLLFDSTMFLTERNNGRKLVQFMQKNPVIFNGKTIGMVFRL